MRVPTIDNFEIQNPGNFTPYQDAPSTSAETFGAGVGQAYQDLGERLNKTANLVYDIKTDIAKTNVEAKYMNEVAPTLDSLDSTYSNSMGKNAMDNYEDAISTLRKQRDDVLNGLQDNQERQMMQSMLDKRIAQSQQSYSKHRDTQFGVYKEDTFKGTVAMYSNNALKAADPNAQEMNIRSALYNIEEWGVDNGKPLEWVNVKKQEFMDTTYKNIIVSESYTDPVNALNHLDQIKDRLNPTIYGEIRKKLIPSETKVLDENFIQGLKEGFVPTKDTQPQIGAVYDIQKNKYTTQIPSNLNTFAQQSAQKYGVPQTLVINTMARESRFNVNAVGPKTKYGSAKGLMQLIDGTASDLGLKGNDVFNPQKNIDAGTKYISQLATKYHNNYVLTMMAYNWGPGNLDKAISKAGGINAPIDKIIASAPKETREYIKEIFGSGSPSSVDIVDETLKEDLKAVGVQQTTSSTPQVQFNKNPDGSFSSAKDIEAFYNMGRKAIEQQPPQVRKSYRNALDAEYKAQKESLHAKAVTQKETVDSIVQDLKSRGEPVTDNSVRSHPMFNDIGDLTPEANKALTVSLNAEAKVRDEEYKTKSNYKLAELSYELQSKPESYLDIRPNELDLTPTDHIKLKTEIDRAKKALNEGTDPGITAFNQEQGYFKKLYTNQFRIGTDINSLRQMSTSSDEGAKTVQSFYETLGIFSNLVETEKKNIGRVSVGQSRLKELYEEAVNFTQDSTPVKLQEPGYWGLYGNEVVNSTVKEAVDDWMSNGRPLAGFNKMDVVKSTKQLAEQGVIINKNDPKQVKDLLMSMGGMR